MDYLCPFEYVLPLTEGESSLLGGFVVCSFLRRHFRAIPVLLLNRMTWVGGEYTHGMPDLMMWLFVLVTAKSARGRVLRMWAVKGHLDWSVMMSLIWGKFSYN